MRPSRVRVVATQTLREARNREEFLRRAEATLELPVEVIPGHEEARLIYTGVAFLHPSTNRRLVIDIGGRSTEMIVGRAGTPDWTDSFPIGSASLSQHFFSGGRMTAARFRAAQRAVQAELHQALAPFSSAGWHEAIGASGTARTLSTVLRVNGVTDGTLTPAGLRWLIERCISARWVDRLELPGLKVERGGLLAGGLSILYTLLMHCGIRRLTAAKGALRQGVIVDMHERELVTRLNGQSPLQRFNFDFSQSRDVANAVLNLARRQVKPKASAWTHRELNRAVALGVAD